MGLLTCFDIETDGLYDEATTIYCMSYTHDGDKIETLTGLPDMVDLLRSSDYVVGHNVSLYDLLVIKKLLGYYPDHALVIDTLWLSWYTDPNRIKHGLEDYGEEFGYPKVKVDDDEWSQGNMDLMIERCERDVEINWKVWTKQRKVLEGLYG
jgi:hypothetical protein